MDNVNIVYFIVFVTVFLASVLLTVTKQPVIMKYRHYYYIGIIIILLSNIIGRLINNVRTEWFVFLFFMTYLIIFSIIIQNSGND